MANKDIQSAVKKAFEVTRDTRIGYNVAEKGSQSLLTGVFEKNSDAASKFYSSPDIADSEETKAAIIFGEVMISPFLIDAGVQSSTNDPSQILKTYRFIMGDGDNEGIVPGPDGSNLENVYLINKNKAPEPIVSGGKVNTGDVVLASVVGGLVSSAPKIWDALFNTAKSDPTQAAPSVDPITGKKVPTPTEKTAAAVRPALDELRNVDSTGKGKNFVLVWDPAAGQWVAKPLNDLIGDAISAGEICGGNGGNGGSGGNGGDGGQGGGSTPTPTPEDCKPTTVATKQPCNPVPETAPTNGMVLLPTIENTADNEYEQLLPAVGTKGLELHFFTAGMGKEEIWDATDPQTPCTTGDYICLTDPAAATIDKVTGNAQIKYLVSSSVSIKICITVNICGNEVLIYSGTASDSGLSEVSYTFNKKIMWTETKLGDLLSQYPGQILNSSNQNVKLYLQRNDTCASEYPVYFEGYTRLIGNEVKRTLKADKTQGNTSGPKPQPKVKKADDGKFPLFKPHDGSIGPVTCPEPIVPTPDAGQPGEPGTPGTGGTDGSDGTCGTVEAGPPKAQPKIAFAEPCAKIYGTQTTPPAFDAVALPALATCTSGMTNTAVTVVYTIDIGDGSFSVVGTPPSGLTIAPSGRQVVLAGNDFDIITASSMLRITPAEGSVGEIHYKAVITNADIQNAGTSCVLVPENLVITDNKSSCSKLTISSSTSGGTAKITVTFNGGTKDLTNGFVPFNTSINQTAADIAANINANVLAKNALGTSDANWLPKYTASATTDTITICGPATSGCEWNGANVDTNTTGGFSFDAISSIKTFLGGACKTLGDFLKNNIPAYSKINDVLYSIAGNVVGAVITNTIMNNASTTQITIPQTEDDTKLAFLYRGLKVRVPQGYNGAARTGMMSYDTWAGSGSVWDRQWTNNPIWCLYEYITNKVFGCGNVLRITATQEEKLLRDLFSLAAYCDELVTDEDGNPQVRFSLNTVITSGSRLQILEWITSNFRGNFSFHFGGLRVTADRETSDVALLVNQGNAQDFSYDVTSSGTFMNKINLTYIEPSNFYKEEVVVANLLGDTNPEVAKSQVYFGCTNRSQAIRQANWALLTEKYNAAIVSYKASDDHFNLVPGQIVIFEDSGERFNGQRYGGRVVSVTGTAMVLDGPISAVSGDLIAVTMQDGTIHKTTISSISGVNVTLVAAPPVAVLESATFVAAPAATGYQLFKVISCEETSTAQYNVTLQIYKTEKFATV